MKETGIMNKIPMTVFITTMFIALLIASCTNIKIDDPLIIPPSFNEVPDLSNPEKSAPKSSDQDLQELKNLLLKN